MALTLVRHTTPNVQTGVCYGRTDLDVTSSFAVEAARVLAALPRVQHIVTSPLLRCRKLAAHLGGALSLSVEIDTRFIEMDFGTWECIPWADVPRGELDAWAADFVNARPHGGESVADLRERVQDGLLAMPKHTLIVTHAGVIKAALAKVTRQRTLTRKLSLAELLLYHLREEPNMSDADDHKAEMQKLQAEQNRKTREASAPNRGLVLVHTGDGKGKSSSAFGVIVRALGWGHKVGVVQFIKGKWITGERQFFDGLGAVDWYTMGDGFTWDTQDRGRDIAAAEAAFSKAKSMLESGVYDLIVLDEINIALRYDYLSIDAVLDGLRSRSDRTSVVLTGRDAKSELCDYADLVSEMREVKHPFKAGIKAQRGIDY